MMRRKPNESQFTSDTGAFGASQAVEHQEPTQAEKGLERGNAEVHREPKRLGRKMEVALGAKERLDYHRHPAKAVPVAIVCEDRKIQRHGCGAENGTQQMKKTTSVAIEYPIAEFGDMLKEKIFGPHCTKIKFVLGEVGFDPMDCSPGRKEVTSVLVQFDQCPETVLVFNPASAQKAETKCQ
jgi:hypothetical protein